MIPGQEFGIDIVSDDSKTIVHHKVAAKVYLVMNQDDAAASSRYVVGLLGVGRHERDG